MHGVRVGGGDGACEQHRGNVFIVARKTLTASPEHCGLAVAERFLQRYGQVTVSRGAQWP